MGTKIFVNLPVRDLDRSTEFFTALGFSFDQRFTDKNATAMVITEDIFAMLLVEPFFKTFTKKEIVDATKATEVIVALSMDSRQEVDTLADKALAAGATRSIEQNDVDFMYERTFHDPDGHLWSIFYMDPAALTES